MEQARANLMRISDIFHEVIESEVKKYRSTGTYKQESKVTFWNIKGDIIFCNRYQAIGDGDGGNEITTRIYYPSSSYRAPTFIFWGKEDDDCDNEYWLHLAYSDKDDNAGNYFIREKKKGSSVDREQIYRVNNEDILGNEDFKKYIVQIISDIAPERVAEIQQLIA